MKVLVIHEDEPLTDVYLQAVIDKLGAQAVVSLQELKAALEQFREAAQEAAVNIQEVVKQLTIQALPPFEECFLELYPRQIFPKPKSVPLPATGAFFFRTTKTGGRARVWR